MTTKEQLKKLLKHQQWNAIRSWFKLFKTKEEQAEKCLLWGRLFLPNYFREPSPLFHRELIASLLSDKDEYIAAPRGFSKTTLAQTVMMFSIVNHLDEFIVLIEKSFTEASEVLFAIRDEYENNDLIKRVYGNLIGTESSGIEHSKAKDAQGDIYINGVRLRAKGFNTPIRGLKSKEYRPTLIICDDIEEDQHITSIDQRIKYKTNFTQGIIPAVDITGSVKMIGTILHEDSLLNNLIKQHNGRLYRAYDKTDPENTLLWPERWSYDRLELKKSQMMIDGLGSSKFYQEYLNEPLDDEHRAFKKEWLQKRFTEIPDNVATYACIDVADSVTDNADYTGVVVASFDDQHNWYIKHAKRYRVTIKELIDLIFDIYQRYSPIQIGVEKKSFEFQVEPLLKDRAEQTTIHPVVVELQHSGKRKEDRIVGALQGRLESGKILFQDKAEDDTNLLIGELYDFPRGKYDDLADAMAYLSTFASRPYHHKKDEWKDPALHDTSWESSMLGRSQQSWEDY